MKLINCTCTKKRTVTVSLAASSSEAREPAVRDAGRLTSAGIAQPPPALAALQEELRKAEEAAASGRRASEAHQRALRQQLQAEVSPLGARGPDAVRTRRVPPGVDRVALRGRSRSSHTPGTLSRPRNLFSGSDFAFITVVKARGRRPRPNADRPVPMRPAGRGSPHASPQLGNAGTCLASAPCPGSCRWR